jgi:thiol:disulfide interchange protein DsbC
VSVLAVALCAIACSPSSADAPVEAAAAKGGAATAAVAPPGTAEARAEIARKLEIPVEAVQPSLVPGLYEIVHSSEVLYATVDGKFVIAGDLYELDSKTNLSERRRAAARAELLRNVADADVVAFGPVDAKYTIDVFTDIDCGYCRKLHEEIAEYNRLGIRVRYLFYPRSGPGTDSWQKAVSVACSPNPQDALTRAKQGEDVPVRNCKTAPVARTYDLGRELQVRGTPGIFTPEGDYVPGYRPPAQMLEVLQQFEAERAGRRG